MVGNHPTHLTSLAADGGQARSKFHYPLEDLQGLMKRPDQFAHSEDLFDSGAYGPDVAKVLPMSAWAPLYRTVFRPEWEIDLGYRCCNLLCKRILMLAMCFILATLHNPIKFILWSKLVSRPSGSL